MEVYPPGIGLPGSESCWPLQCVVPANSASTTTCGQGAVHKEQLTGGTSSVGFAESIAFTTKMPSIGPAAQGQCVRSCIDSQVLITSQGCSAFSNSPSSSQPPPPEALPNSAPPPPSLAGSPP
eukprot:scaffold134397_cov31-Prasinocladus_malaysianus.AAC.1